MRLALRFSSGSGLKSADLSRFRLNRDHYGRDNGLRRWNYPRCPCPKFLWCCAVKCTQPPVLSVAFSTLPHWRWATAARPLCSLAFFHALNSSRSDPLAPFSANLCPDQITGSAPNAPCEVPLSQKSPSYLKLSSLCELNARPRLRFHIQSTHLFPFVINTCYSKALKPYWCSAKKNHEPNR